MKHIIVTRCKFGDDEKFQNYFEVMKKTYIPSINSQTDKNFTIGLIVNPKHYDLIRELITKDIEIIPFKDAKVDYMEYVIKNGFTLQTRHDCDDSMNSNYIEHIHNLYEQNKSKYDDFILNFHPTKFVINTGKEYTHGRDYSRVCSMFTTLIQKNVKNGIMNCMHDYLNKYTKNIIYIPRGYVKLTIHGNNVLSKLSNNDKPLN
jgi:signal peptidase I